MAEKSSTKTSTRIAIIVGATTFLLTSIATSVFVIIDAMSDKDDNTSTSTPAETSVGEKLEGFTPVQEVPELIKTDTQAGEGEEVKAGDTVTVIYTGALARTGEIFESNAEGGEPATFGLNGVIKGWTDGIPGMKVGGTRQLVIPSDLAYGSAGSPPKIGPNEPLVFNVTVLAIGGDTAQ